MHTGRSLQASMSLHESLLSIGRVVRTGLIPVAGPTCELDKGVGVHDVADQLVAMLEGNGMQPRAFVHQDDDGVPIMAHMVDLGSLGTTSTALQVLLEEQLCVIIVRVQKSLDGKCTLHWSCKAIEFPWGPPSPEYREYAPPAGRALAGHAHTLSSEEVSRIISQSHY